eukprot:scaffold92556_cov63-Phaeocystis_antarctica.AAC.4
MGACEASEVRSLSDGIAEPVGVVGVSEDILEEGGHCQRLLEQKGVQIARGGLARLDDEEASVGRDVGSRRLTHLGKRREREPRATFVEIERVQGMQQSELSRWQLHKLRAAVKDERAWRSPISGGSTTSEQRRRLRAVRLCSCRISEGSSASFWQPCRSRVWTRPPSLDPTPFHEDGLASGSVHHSRSTELAVLIARSVSSSGRCGASPRPPSASASEESCSGNWWPSSCGQPSSFSRSAAWSPLRPVSLHSAVCASHSAEKGPRPSSARMLFSTSRTPAS